MTEPNVPIILNLFLNRAFNKRNRMTLLILMLLGSLVGFCKIWFSEPTYHSSIVSESPYIKSGIMVDLVNEMKPFVEEEEKYFVSKKLGLSLKTTEILEKLNAKQLEEVIGKKTELANRFTIDICTKENDVILIDSIFDGLLELIRSNSYVKEKIDLERLRISDYELEIKKKIEELEDFQSQSVDRIKFTQELVSYHNSIVDLHKRRGELVSQLNNIVPLLVINNDPYPIEVEKKYLNEVLLYSFSPPLAWVILILIMVFVQAPDRLFS